MTVLIRVLLYSYHNLVKGRKPIHGSTCDPAIPSLRVMAAPREAASINHPRHQVKPHQRPFMFEAPLLVPTLIPSLHLRIHLPSHLRALTVLKDGRGRCSGSHRGSSRWLSVVLASRMTATGGSAQQKRKLRRRKRRKRCPRRDGPSSPKRKSGGTRKEDDAGSQRACSSSATSRPMTLQREAKQASPRASWQALLTDTILGALASADANLLHESRTW